MDIVIVGGGVFGWAAADAARARGWRARVVDPGPLPHPLAESTDISKAVRADYGADDLYFGWMLDALDGWRRWNTRWGEELFHEGGVSYLAGCPLSPGGFEYESLARLRAAGVPVDRLDAAAIHARFPAWRPGAFVDGYTHGMGGWAESGKVVERLARGGDHVPDRVVGLIEDGAGCAGCTSPVAARCAATWWC